MPNLTPQLEIRHYDPTRRWRIVLLLAFGWAASLAVVALAASMLRGRESDARYTEQLVQATGETDDLKARIVGLERSEQIAKTALANVQQMLKDRDEEIDSLRADLAFYGRMVGGARSEGLAVHTLRVQPVKSSPQAWNFTATLTQDFKRGRDTKGYLTLNVEGVTGGKLKTLDWDTLSQGQGASGIEYDFKYFQQVGGTIMFPAGFVPNRVIVRADGEDGRSEQKIPWKDAVKGEENE